MPRSMNPKPEKLKEYKQVVDEWLVNGYNGVKAWQAIYPNVEARSATACFTQIRKIPAIQEYIKQRRQEAFEDKCIDLQRVTEEIAKMAFCPNGDSYIPASVKAKALEMLQKAMREDARLAATKQDETITIGVEDEDNTEEESV